MTDEQKKNLRSLLKLETMERKSRFDMASYFFTPDDDGLIWSQRRVTSEDYGVDTTANLIGHLPLTTGITKRADEDWFQYCNRVVGVKKQLSWHFLFSNIWANRHNGRDPGTLDQAMIRIRCFISNGYDVSQDFTDSPRCNQIYREWGRVPYRPYDVRFF